MPGFDAPRNDAVPEAVSAHNTRLGLVLFTAYLIIYALFVVLSAFWPETLDQEFGGVNLGIVYGFGLIGLAFLLALVYAWMCRPPDVSI